MELKKSFFNKDSGLIQDLQETEPSFNRKRFFDSVSFRYRSLRTGWFFL